MEKPDVVALCEEHTRCACEMRIATANKPTMVTAHGEGRPL